MNKYKLIFTFLVFFFVNAAAQDFQLADPMLDFDEILFYDQFQIEAKLDLNGALLRYTLDGEEVDVFSPEINGPILIDKDCTLKVKAFHEEFIASNTVSQEFKKVEKESKIASIKVSSEPHELYSSAGDESLIDLRKGSFNFRDGRWLAYKGKDVGIDLRLKKKSQSLDILVGYLVDKDAWIFGPGMLIVSAFDLNENIFKEVKKIALKEVVEDQEAVNDFIAVKKDLSFTTNQVRIELKRFKEIPAWHPGNVDNTWIFVDEILLR